MKHYILATTLALTPITGVTFDKDACDGIKAIASLCVLLRKNDLQQEEALKMFSKYNEATQNAAKVICNGVYQLEHIEILSDEGIANAFYKTCMKH